MKTLTTSLAALAIAAALAPAPASADLSIRRTCFSRNNCIITVQRVENLGGLGKVVDVPSVSDPARDARIAQWESFCQPQLMVDTLGVSRYVYAHKGCDIGRSQ